MKLSFVIPVYRNEGSITPTYEKLIDLIKQLAISYEFIFVDDGSDDNSLKELMVLREKDQNVNVLTFSRNFGQVAAVIAGLKQVTGD
nr:glycosyltransferase [Flavobacterium sp.]